MKTLLLLLAPLMLLAETQDSTTSPEGPPVVVVSFTWIKARQAVEKLNAAPNGPAPAMIPENRNYAKNARLNNPSGALDPNEATIDGRSAAIEKIVQEARTDSGKPVDGFAYRAKVQNASNRVIEILFWEYRFSDPSDPALVARRQFLCGVNIKPARDKELQAFSVSGPSDVVSVATLSHKSDYALQEKVVINRVEYADGTIWQRKDWNFGEIRMTYRRAVASPWGSEMCRAL